MVDRAFQTIINSGMLESNHNGDSLISSQYRLTDLGKSVVRKGNYEEIFENVITTRNFFFTNNGEYGFSDIYQKSGRGGMNTANVWQYANEGNNYTDIIQHGHNSAKVTQVNGVILNGPN